MLKRKKQTNTQTSNVVKLFMFYLYVVCAEDSTSEIVSDELRQDKEKFGIAIEIAHRAHRNHDIKIKQYN